MATNNCAFVSTVPENWALSVNSFNVFTFLETRLTLENTFYHFQINHSFIVQDSVQFWRGVVNIFWLLDLTTFTTFKSLRTSEFACLDNDIASVKYSAACNDYVVWFFFRVILWCCCECHAWIEPHYVKWRAIYTGIDRYFIILSSEAKGVSTTYNLEDTKNSNIDKYFLVSVDSPLTACMFL